MGNAVVISADQNGEIAFTRKGIGDGYLLSTNFNLANPENGKYPCWRFDTASRMLRKIEHKNAPGQQSETIFGGVELFITLLKPPD